MEPELERLRERVRERGLWGPQVPQELGGLGLTLLDHALVSEKLGQTTYGHYVLGAEAPDAGNLEIRSFKCSAGRGGGETCGADAYGEFDRADFGVTFGQSFGFNMGVVLRIQIEARAP